MRNVNLCKNPSLDGMGQTATGNWRMRQQSTVSEVIQRTRYVKPPGKTIEV